MQLNRRSFVQLGAALGVSLALPIKSAAKMVLPEPIDEGFYGAFAFTERLMQRRLFGVDGIFYGVTNSKAIEIIREYGFYDSKNSLTWIKVPTRPTLFPETKHERVPSGTMVTRYCSVQTVICKNGKVISVMKNKLGGFLPEDVLVPRAIHLATAPVFHTGIGFRADAVGLLHSYPTVEVVK